MSLSGEACSATTPRMTIKHPPTGRALLPANVLPMPHDSVLRFVTRRYGAFTQTRGRKPGAGVAAQKDNFRGRQLPQAGVGVGCGPGPLRNAGIGSLAGRGRWTMPRWPTKRAWATLTLRRHRHNDVSPRRCRLIREPDRPAQARRGHATSLISAWTARPASRRSRASGAPRPPRCGSIS